MNHLIVLVLEFMIISVTIFRVKGDILNFYSSRILTQGLVAFMIVAILYLVSLRKWK